ncbi:MAG: class I SAM-dependent methyltransferase [Pseudomonadota bacterium]
MSQPHPPPTTGRRDQAWWDARYREGERGWDKPVHAPQIEAAVARFGRTSGRVLDLGCGRGRNSRFLASVGFSVLGVDISGEAIADARAQAGALDCAFFRLDVLSDPIPDGPFEAVFDYGCFHVFDTDEDRATLARVVAGVLAPGGLWLATIGSTDGPPRTQGPPRRSARDVVLAIEPRFEILELVRGELDAGEAPPRTTWQGVFRKR